MPRSQYTGNASSRLNGHPRKPLHLSLWAGKVGNVRPDKLSKELSIDLFRCYRYPLKQRGRAEVDFHSYTFDAHGKIVFGVEYPFDSLTGTGSIHGYPVKCISPEWMVKFHSGYELDGNDYRDVSALCERFGIALPAEYERFTQEGAG